MRISITQLLVIGGSDAWYSYGRETGETYFYDVTNNEWSKGPTLKTARNSHSCALLSYVNPSTKVDERIVVVVGGTSKRRNLDSVELLFLDDENKSEDWHPGQDLPRPMASSLMIAVGNSVILLNQARLYRLSDPNNFWDQLQQTLPSNRESSVAFLIPDNLVDCKEIKAEIF